MPPLHNLDPVPLRHLRPHIPIPKRHLSKTLHHICLRNRCRRLLYNLRKPGRKHPQLLQQITLQRLTPILRRKHLFLHLLQLRRDVPLRIHQCLFTNKMIRHLLLMRIRDLDIVPKHLIIPDLQRRNLRFPRQIILNLRNILLPVPCNIPQLIQRRIKPLPKHAPLTRLHRRFLD